MSNEIFREGLQSVNFSPQQALPLFVLQRIFSLVCIPCHRPPQKCRRPDCRVSYPLILGKVCRTWRDVAWRTPALWNQVDMIVAGKGYGKQFETQVQLLDEWLQRTEDQLLSICVRPLRGTANLSFPPPTAVFEVLAKYSMHWKELDLYCPEDCLPALNVARGRIPFLESLIINTSGRMNTGSTLDFLAYAPKLRFLDCTTLRLTQDNYWPNLTSLIARGDSKTAISLLRFATNLEHCRIEGVHERHTTSAGEHQAASDGASLVNPLRRLKSLLIKQCETSDFLTQIEAPFLQRLSIIKVSSFPFERVIDFLDRSGCKLRALGVAVNTPFDVQVLQDMLSRCESVTRLYIGSTKASDYQALMHKIPRMLDPDISGSGGKSVVLPDLQILYYSTIDPVRSEDMIKMIKNRWNEAGQPAEESAGSKISKLRIVRFKKSNMKILFYPLKAEIEQGLEVTYDLPYEGEPFE